MAGSGSVLGRKLQNIGLVQHGEKSMHTKGRISTGVLIYDINSFASFAE